LNLESWDPDERLGQFRRQSNLLLDQLLTELQSLTTGQNPVAFLPEVDLVETEDEFRIYLSIPGAIEDDLGIIVDESGVTIHGERRPPYEMEKRDTAIQEWRYGFFERRIGLPAGVSVSGIRADYDAGVLTIVAGKLGKKPGSAPPDDSTAGLGKRGGQR